MRVSLPSAICFLFQAWSLVPFCVSGNRQIYQFPNATFIENIAVRPNGHLLLDTFDQGRVYSIDPAATNPKPYIIAQLPAATAIGGIAQIEPDVFAVCGGILNQTTRRLLEGTAKIFLLDLRECGTQPSQSCAAVDTVATVFDTESLNGMTALPQYPQTVLTVDSVGGRIFRTNTVTGYVDVAFQNDNLAIGKDSPPGALGGNGIKIYGGHLYFTNSMLQLFGRIPITATGEPTGEVATIVSGKSIKVAYDDFAITSAGISYVAGHPSTLVRITQNGEQDIISNESDSVTLLEPTSVALSVDEKKLYVVTGGTITDGIARGGQVVEFLL